MRLTPQILPDREAIGEVVAEIILDRMSAKGDKPFLLGCPSGRTAVPVYDALAREAARGRDLSNLVIVMMDDYVVPDETGRYRVVDPDSSYSCLGFALRDILAPIAAASESSDTAAPSQVWTADPAAPEDYDARISAAGGIDLFLLASGDSDGHVAFNQPGTPRDAKTHIVTLGEATRRDNMATFPEFTHLDMVPGTGVTVGVDTIAWLSAEVVMILSGEHKREAFARITSAEAYEDDWPATIVTECRNPLLLVDRAAAAVPV
ncbi:6-phosphogluconolactonase [Microbacterium sp. QXD-8]|uniref:6-phosphogluconolactonase n=1 Tax=Microbacterium psychrotolerans TaxID=3068321 RepID=A0ABU0YXM4_9MICO|nr:6-phosphogluconolactonase [Microbacterium sp. QXD-8]MDQ7877075.1 6-phosphogluconolactonase [Microbacterium sp. QXD-8]